MSGHCVICGKPISKERKKKDTCSDVCGYTKVMVWAEYLHEFKETLMQIAIGKWKERNVKK